MPHWPPLPAWVLLIAGAIGAILSRIGPVLNWLHGWYQQRQLTRPQVLNLEALTDKTLAETIGLLATRVEQQEQKIGTLLRANEEQEAKLRAALEENATNRAKLQNAQEINATQRAELESLRAYIGEMTRSLTEQGGSVGPTGTVKLKAS